MTIQKKLDIEIREIILNEKKKHGLLLTHDDINVIFSILKQNDKETKLMLEIIQNNLVNIDIKENYVYIEDSVKKILNYYHIIGTPDLLNCRHKFFFTTQENKLTKKPFFSKKTIDNIRKELTINNIIEKLK